MGRLRFITTVLAFFGLAVLLSYPFTIGVPPKKDAPLKARKQWAARLVVFSGLAGFSFVGAAFGAVLILRRVRRDFAEQSLNNLAELITAEVQSKKTTDA